MIVLGFGQHPDYRFIFRSSPGGLKKVIPSCCQGGVCSVPE